MKKTKRFVSLALTVILLISLLIPALSFADSKGASAGKGGQPSWVIDKLKDKFEFMDGKKIKFNNMNVKFDVPPVIKSGRTLIPVRAIEAMGAVVLWDAELKLVTITKDDIRIFMDLKNGKVYVVDADVAFKDVKTSDEVAIEAKPGMINNRTYVPLRFIAEVLGLKVDYDKGEVNVQDQPKIAPTKLTFEDKSDIVTGSAIKVILNGYDFDGVKGLDERTAADDPTYDYYYDTDLSKVFLSESYLEDFDIAATELTFEFSKTGEADVEKVLEIKFLYNMPVVEAEEPKYEGDDTDFVINVNDEHYTFDSLWLKVGKNLTEIDDGYYDLSGGKLTIEHGYFDDVLDVSDNDVVTLVFKFTKTSEDDVTVELEIPVDL